MKRRGLTITLAAALGALGVILTLAYVKAADARAVDHNNPVWVLAAAQPIPVGTPTAAAVHGHLLESVRYPKGALPQGYLGRLTSKESAEVFTTALQPGAIVTANMIGSNSQTSSHLVLPGTDVAVSIPVCQTAAVAGYIGPGARVAIDNVAGRAHPMQSSCSSHVPPAGGTVATVVLPDVLVLAVQAAPSQASALATPATAPAGTSGCSASSEGELCVTVAVPTADQLKLVDVAATGDLALVLLSATSTLPNAGDSYTSP